MTTYRSIVVVAPEAGTSPAVGRAVALARASGASLHLFTPVFDPSIDFAETRVGAEVAAHARHDVVRERGDRLAELAKSLGNDVAVDAEARWSSVPHEAVLDKVRATGAQLVVKGAQRESALQRALHPPFDRKLMRLVPCELMLVGSHGTSPLTRVAVAVDLLAPEHGAAAFNHRILRCALRLAQYYGATLDVLSVFSMLPLYGATAAAVELAMEKDQARHREAFTAFMGGEQVPAERRHLLVGAPAQQIADFCRSRQIDLLVCGSNHHAGWERLLLGSTAESLALDVASDLLLVKSEGFEHVLAGRLAAANAPA